MKATQVDEAFTRLVAAHGDTLTRYAYLLTGEWNQAQDLVQDALVKVFVRTRRGFTPDVLEAYVRRTIITLYIDGYRRRTKLASVTHLLADEETRTGPDESSAARLDLHAALATLGRQERAAVVLRYFADLTVPEIADQMGIAPGTIKRYLNVAIHKLETRLGPMPALRADDDRTVITLATPNHETGRS